MEALLKAIHSRKLDKIAATYAVGGWVLVQAASIAQPTFDLPNWSLRAFIVSVCIGFPLTLAFAWFAAPRTTSRSPVQRKLVAILIADLVGWGALMRKDETGAVEQLRSNRSLIIDPQVSLHGGRTFKLVGDGDLVEFPSAVAAVKCALAIQRAVELRIAGGMDHANLRYRIGVNLGEVIVDGSDLYGDGVNVAAGIQVHAPPGDIAISRVVRDEVDGKIPCAFEDLGEKALTRDGRLRARVFIVRPANTPAISQGTKVSDPTTASA